MVITVSILILGGLGVAGYLVIKHRKGKGNKKGRIMPVGIEVYDENGRVVFDGQQTMLNILGSFNVRIDGNASSGVVHHASISPSSTAIFYSGVPEECLTVALNWGSLHWNVPYTENNRLRDKFSRNPKNLLVYYGNI